MARNRAPENMTHTELTELRSRIDRLMERKRTEAKASLREKITQMARAHGMSMQDVLGGKTRNGRGGGKGIVAIKYRDPKNPANTWTGRGRTPRWMVAAMKGRKAKKEDFLIK
jgi:DNA-binding protein H-NS